MSEGPARKADSCAVVRAPLYPHVLGIATAVAIEPVLGVRYLSVAHWLRQFWSWPEERRRRWQQLRVDEMVGYAARAVPFYRSLVGPRGDIRLGDLPVVDKGRIRGDMTAFLSDRWQEVPHITKATGGTTGDPWRYPLDKVAWSHMYGAALHAWERTGYRYGDRMVLLGSPPSLVPGGRSWKSKARLRLERRFVSAAGIEIDRAESRRRVVTAGRLGAALWYGYAGTIARMAEAVLDEGLPVTPPGAIVTTSETLTPEWRRRIDEAFGVDVVDEYGCNDGGVLAHSCAGGRYHIAENVSFVEVVDGDTPCPPGVEGDVAVTNLHARALPFLRYKIGDRAVLGNGRCPCGRPGTTFERLLGRTADTVRLPDGRELSAISFGHVFKETPRVRRWQVVQPDVRTVKVRLEVESELGSDEAERIQRYFCERVGREVAVELTTVERMERTAGGKHKIVVRLFE